MEKYRFQIIMFSSKRSYQHLLLHQLSQKLRLFFPASGKKNGNHIFIDCYSGYQWVPVQQVNGSLQILIYSEPDYEMLVDQDCDVAIESTMILHTPKVQEMIEDLDIPVFIDRSSYETHPLARTEWIKLYGAMLDKEEEQRS